MVGVERFELPTSCSQSRRATRLRYTPIKLARPLTVERAGIIRTPNTGVNATYPTTNLVLPLSLTQRLVGE